MGDLNRIRLDDELTIMKELARLGGATIWQYYCLQDVEVRKKEDKTRTTEADIVVDKLSSRLISGRLQIPSSAILSEESSKVYDSAKHRWTYFTLDPMCGTSDFRERTGTFAVMIGKVQDGKAVKGVVFQPTGPLSGILWYGVRGKGAYMKEPGRKTQRLHVSDRAALTNIETILSRKDYVKPEVVEKIKEFFPHVQQSGSFGIKTGKIAQGECDVYWNESERAAFWDSVPGQVLLEEAGGTVTDLNNRIIIYDGQTAPYLPNGAFCSNTACHNIALQRYKALKSAK